MTLQQRGAPQRLNGREIGGSPLRCPKCAGCPTATYDSRPTADGQRVRRRFCLQCGHRFVTTEAAKDLDKPMPQEAFGWRHAEWMAARARDREAGLQ